VAIRMGPSPSGLILSLRPKMTHSPAFPRVSPMRPPPIISEKGALGSSLSPVADLDDSTSTANPLFSIHACLRAHLRAPLEASNEIDERRVVELWLNHASDPETTESVVIINDAILMVTIAKESEGRDDVVGF
jgi:hypothetical protein